MAEGSGVVVVGGGWAGLAAALELQAHGIPISLYESAPQLGGRARNAPFDGLTVDNGQHLLIGAYTETLRLLHQMGVAESEVLLRTRLNLKVVEGNEQLQLSPPPLPAPLHLAWAQLTAKGLTIGERLRALRMSLKLMASGFKLKHDISVAALLQQHNQSERITRRLWEPLCLATLNTPMKSASAQLFLRVLQDSFSRSRHDADLLLPKLPLGELFPNRAADYLRERGNRMHLRSRVEAIRIETDRVKGVSVDGEELNCDTVIIATAPRAAARLLAPHAQLERQHAQIAALGSQPVTTLYLQYPSEHRLEEPMLGMSNTLSQWLFDRHHCGQPGLIAVVVSAKGAHDSWSNETLSSHVLCELQRQFPHWPQPLSSRVIREKHATFESRVGIEALRPSNTTPVAGLWLAGDYTDTGYPATLEGAVRSGVECARRIINARRKTNS